MQDSVGLLGPLRRQRWLARSAGPYVAADIGDVRHLGQVDFRLALKAI